ncbi:hypothetical protein HanRHA438_Chr12g0535461 [Helianthus annuus]|uniref:Uncharacterized protein n=1 Tax=Helianthus annuus TaxID=4232 RepID=A0A9K3EP21_HELAN|nr:hypothetical protein HanXRQr2_Chr12g0523831 [Helianthus annuus]KAJ0491484.1 hypothetical protein HanIR_Chr12g0564291 [Helianthus annuus]KAJ0503933.1 hypothetical protein HanHA89_Chr12g0453811 [Helianthus annuus]KAJ0673620.1 hypothetical protein HanLR1_Chr12g0431121 [Helianthus annuus]KAJ0864959.1 hypothetical protein HanRHA438_Chr12g0535461 [Helianthus annuus]
MEVGSIGFGVRFEMGPVDKFLEMVLPPIVFSLFNLEVVFGNRVAFRFLGFRFLENLFQEKQSWISVPCENLFSRKALTVYP